MKYQTLFYRKTKKTFDSLKALITTTTDDTLKYFVIFFIENKTDFIFRENKIGISCHMKCQSYFL